MRIIIDTDIGDDIDDAFAISLALSTPEIQVLGITTVFRNALKRAKIVKALLDTHGISLPVYAGESEPMSQKMSKLVYEKNIRIDSDGTVNVPHYSSEFENYQVESGAIDYLLEQAECNNGELTVLAIGPLTNLARAHLKNPIAFSKIKQIVMMGGQAKGDFAEWNFRCDPESAKTVFDSGVPIKMIGINVTKFCRFSESDINSFKQEYTDSECILLSKMLNKWLADNQYQKMPIMHDGLAVAELTKNFCTYEVRNVSVCTQDEKRGMLCEGKNPVQIALTVENEKFIGYLFDRLRRKS